MRITRRRETILVASCFSYKYCRRWIQGYECHRQKEDVSSFMNHVFWLGFIAVIWTLIWEGSEVLIPSGRPLRHFHKEKITSSSHPSYKTLSFTDGRAHRRAMIQRLSARCPSMNLHLICAPGITPSPRDSESAEPRLSHSMLLTTPLDIIF